MIDWSEFLGWLHPLAFGLVLGGAGLVATFRSTAGERAAAFAALLPLLRANPRADADVARRIVARVERVAEAKSIVCADRVATAGRFLTEATCRLADARGSEAYERWAEETLADRAGRHGGAIEFWRSVADSAPAMGMIATVIGLIRIFMHMDDPTRIGAPMATALLATLLGLIVANLIAGPIADRLQRLSEAELAWQRRALDHFVALARAELDGAVGLQRTLARRLGA